MLDNEVYVYFWKECLKLKQAAQLVSIPHPLSVCNVTLAFKSLSIKPKVELQMLFKLIAAAKDSWACFRLKGQQILFSKTCIASEKSWYGHIHNQETYF